MINNFQQNKNELLEKMVDFYIDFNLKAQASDETNAMVMANFLVKESYINQQTALDNQVLFISTVRRYVDSDIIDQNFNRDLKQCFSVLVDVLINLGVLSL